MPIPINVLRAACSVIKQKHCNQCPSDAACRQHAEAVCRKVLTEIYDDVSLFSRGNRKTEHEESTLEMMLDIHVASRGGQALRDRRRRRRAA